MTYSTDVQRWEVEYTDEFETWWDQLSEDDQERTRAAVEILEDTGPALGRLTRDRVAILLLGGDKSGRWKAWYVEAIAAADGYTKSTSRSCEREES